MKQMINHILKFYADLMAEKNNLAELELYSNDGEIIRHLTYNSKDVVPGTLFICKGAAFKPEYLLQAVKAGAVCYVSEKPYPEAGEFPHIIVKDIRSAMPDLADSFYCSAWEDIHMIGFGGTKGKSTSAYYMKAVLDTYLGKQNKKESAVISSIDVYDGVIREESHITTPEAVELHRHIRNAVDSDIEFLDMEVSSQALKYGRVANIMFDVAVFLNISEDHISPIEHPDFEDYFRSKLKIFSQTKTGIVNIDADFSDRILDAASVCPKVITTSCKNPDADFYAYNIRKEGIGTAFEVRCDKFDRTFRLTMPGFFNVENALTAIAAAVEFNIPIDDIYNGLLNARSSGRMELFSSKDNKILAIVDYAHNKLSFEKLYSSTKEEYPDRDIISIFGCPGKKAFIRRRDLAVVADEYAKHIYLTAEDPGYEPVSEISADIASNIKNCPYSEIEDRGEAIRTAIENASGPCVLLITGKGRETRQKYNDQYLDCPSDVDYVLRYLEAYDSRS